MNGLQRDPMENNQGRNQVKYRVLRDRASQAQRRIPMSKFTAVLLGTLVILALGAAVAVEAATQYDAILEWTGPHFRTISTPAISQLADDPIVDAPFVQPYAVGAREHAAGQRDVVYVVDSGNNRVQAFESNATYNYYSAADLTYTGGGVAAASQWDSDQIYVAQWVAGATAFILPFSEVVTIDGVTWTWVSSLAGFTAADKVYTIDFDDTTNAPEIQFPASSLTATSTIGLRYLVSNENTGAAAAFGIGDVDYGTGAGAAPVLTLINEASGGPSSWQLLRSIAVTQNEVTATSDDLFVVDSADNSTNGDEKLFFYTVAVAGTVAYGEAYDDALNQPFDVAVGRSGASTGATVTPSADTGPFDLATAAIGDASQVTGHTYAVTVAGANVTIVDSTTGRTLLTTGAFASMSNPFLGIPGLSLPLNGVIGGNITIATARVASGRYLFVADTYNDRIKVVDAADGSGASFTGDWLPGDVRTSDDQEVAAIGGNAGLDVRQTTPASVPEGWKAWTTAFPIKENTLSSITFDPAGTPVTWTRVNSLRVAGPTDEVYEVDSLTGMITFGDGVHGEIPPVTTPFEYTYTTTVDVLRYGVSGTGNGRFSAPKGVAARYNSDLGLYDVYVADSGNNRIQKFAFYPADAALNLPARMSYVTQWNTVSGSSDKLTNPVDVVVGADGAGAIWVAVADQGNDRIVVYRDNAAEGTGLATAPTFDSTFGSQGNTLGKYAELSGLALLTNSNDFDIYAADSQRGTVTKYEEAPTPAISLTFLGASVLPECFPPSGSYPFTWTSSNPPAGGTIDFYYDTKSTFDATTAKLCFTASTITSTAVTATWTFSSSPTGTPLDNTGGYYLFARMKDSLGNTVASDATTSTERLCIDSSILPNLAALDAIDNDRALSVQNGVERVVKLTVSYPDSVTNVGYTGSFDPASVEILAISPGNAWDGTGAVDVLFTQSFNNTTGAFQVNSSGLGTPSGLTGNGPHVIAHIAVKGKSSALTTSTRVTSSTMAVSKTSSYMKDKDGASPTSWKTKSLDVKVAYLGDIASNGSGADSTVPYLRVKPDGLINFDDQMTFTNGWNGDADTHEQDRIADLGPTTGSAPDLVSVPDGLWNVDDILAFTTMYSWAATSGFVRPAPGTSEFAVTRVVGSRPLANGSDVAGQASAYTVSHVENPLPGSTFTVDVVVSGENLSGAHFNLAFDPSQVEPVEVHPGSFFNGRDGNLFFQRAGQDWLEISASRLDRATPGSSGSGVVAQVTFRQKSAATRDFDLAYDLRGVGNSTLSRGNLKTGPLSGSGSSFGLVANYPNPMQGVTAIVFSLANAGEVELDVYDAAGRLVKNVVHGALGSGYHVVNFDGRSLSGQPIAAGVYFYQLRHGEQVSTRKMIVAR